MVDINFIKAMIINPLPPLPLIPDALGNLWLFIDNSSIENLTTCPRAFEYSWLRKKRCTGERPALNFGSAIHAALEARYKDDSYDYLSGETEQKMFDALTLHFEQNPQPDGEFRTLDMATKIIRKYNQKYLTESFEVCRLEDGKRCVEMPFALPLTKEEHEFVYYNHHKKESCVLNVMYTGKIDIVLREHNQIYTLDHKTAYQFGSSFWQDQQMSGQHVGYCWAIDQILGVRTSGYKINALRTRKGSKKDPDPIDEDLERNTYYITDERKLEWKQNLISTIEEFLWNYSRQYMPMRTKWCVGKYGACQFFDVCSLPKDQRQGALESGLYQDDTWSPLHKDLQDTKLTINKT